MFGGNVLKMAELGYEQKVVVTRVRIPNTDFKRGYVEEDRIDIIWVKVRDGKSVAES
jgi:hypothetical protein